MDIRKSLLLTVCFFCTQALQSHWIDKMSRDSQVLLGQLKNIEKHMVGDYILKKEEASAKKELEKGTNFYTFAKAIENNMGRMTFNLKPVGKLRVGIPVEFIEYLKLKGKQKTVGTEKNFAEFQPFFDKGGIDRVWNSVLTEKERDALADILGISKRKRTGQLFLKKVQTLRELFTKMLKKILLAAFNKDRRMLEFIQKHIPAKKIKIDMLYDNKRTRPYIEAIFEKKIDENYVYYVLRDEIFDASVKAFGAYMPKPVLYDTIKGFSSLQGYKVSHFRGIRFNTFPTLFVPYRPKKVRMYSLDDKARKKVVERLITQMAVFKKYFAALSHNLKIKPFDVYIVPFVLAKIFPGFRKSFDATHIISSEVGDVICVFKKEELLKNVLDELNFLMGVEQNLQSKWAKGRFAVVPSHLDMQDALVESLACITNVVMSAYETSARSFWPVVSQMWERERFFGMYQAAKVLYMSGFTNFEHFVKPRYFPKVKQSAPAVENFIFKAALMQDPSAFLNLFMNKRYRNKKEFNNAFKFFLLANINSSAFIERMNALLKVFRKKGVSKQNFFLFKTGRLSIIEPQI